MNGRDLSPTASSVARWSPLDSGLARFSGAVFVLCGILFANLEVAPTEPLQPAVRYPYWVGFGLATWVCFLAAAWLTVQLIPAVRRSAVMQFVLQVLGATVLLAPCAASVDLVLGLDPPLDDLASAPAAWLDEWTELILPVGLTWALANLPWWMRLSTGGPIQRAKAALPPDSLRKGTPPERAPGMPTATTVGGRDALWRGLPPTIRGDIAHIRSDLQYLWASSPHGEGMVLGTLAEVEALYAENGLRVHRSHFVIDAHVRRLVRDGSGWALLMSTGVRVPISRRRLTAARNRYGALRETIPTSAAT